MKGNQYLKKPEQFNQVYKKGKSYSNALLVIKVIPNDIGKPRIGLSVSKRVGNAVTRNRIKRLVREVFRLNSFTCDFDLLVIARKPSANASYWEVKKALLYLLFRAGVYNNIK